MGGFFIYTGSIKHQEANGDSKWSIDNTCHASLGINSVSAIPYIEVNEIQDRNHEYIKIQKALEKYKENYAVTYSINIAALHFQFINWGRTELVYVLKNRDAICETVLIKQPAVRMGKVQQEAKNLTKLRKRDNHVVAPIEYFQIGDQELYTTPYIYQARCIAADNGWWGMYIPEPTYRFECFTDEVADMVCIGMIAKLVSLYDHQEQIGIGACRLSGGDFMFPKDWNSKEITMNSILDNLYLIAAREMIACPFEEYLDILKREFTMCTSNGKQQKVLINVRGKAIMRAKIIEKGIRLGIEITPDEAIHEDQKKYLLTQLSE